MYPSVAQRKADDQTRARLCSLDDALEAQGKPRHLVYDWTMAQKPVEDDWTWQPEPTSAGLEDLL